MMLRHRSNIPIAQEEIPGDRIQMPDKEIVNALGGDNSFLGETKVELIRYIEGFLQLLGVQNI